MTLTEFEVEVLEMCAGTKDWPTHNSAWVNACLEFLQEEGYVMRGSTKLTDKGRWYFGAKP